MSTTIDSDGHVWQDVVHWDGSHEQRELDHTPDWHGPQEEHQETS